MTYYYVSWDKFNPMPIPQKKRPGRSKTIYCQDYISLDTETSKNKDIAWMYQWCFSYPDDDHRLLVYGRTPSQLATTLKRVYDVNNLDDSHKLICYIHNASYDYAYFHKHLEKEFGFRGELLAVGTHRIIMYSMHGLEFRDSLKIAMKSLDAWCTDLGTKHGKLKGAIDYNETRYQDSRLGRQDWRYMFTDVICLDEAVEKQLEIHHDTISTIPLTNTGYVRRVTKRKFFEERSINQPLFRSKALDYDLYDFCRREFAGAITHGNRIYMGITVKLQQLMLERGRKDLKIKHRDFQSHYPTQQICKYGPLTRFSLYFDHEHDGRMTVQELSKLTQDDNCFLAGIVVSNLHIREGVTLPYAQFSKFWEGKIGNIKCCTDNGRILHMNGESFIVVNELDLKWLVKQYHFDCKILKVYRATKGKFPKYIRDTVKQFFYEKSFYKKEEKKVKKKHGESSKEFRDIHLKLMIAKGMLNAIYGMTATNPVRVEFKELDSGEWSKQVLTEAIVTEKLEDFYSKNNVMNYELGLWTTAQARNQLLEFAELIGYENFLYGDTDSIFYISTPEIEKKIEEVNRLAREECDKNGWYVEVDGERTYYNQFEDEDEDITEFRFLHSKCYAYATSDGELHTTIAGVKAYGRNNMTRVRELGDIDALQVGKVFKDCGGTTIAYPPKGYDASPREVIIDGHKTEVAQWAMIMESTKELRSVVEEKEDLTLWTVVDQAD